MAHRSALNSLLVMSCLTMVIEVRCQEPGRESAGRSILQGQLLYAKQEWVKAIEKFDEAIQLDVKSSAAFEWRATARLQLAEWDIVFVSIENSGAHLATAVLPGK
jgi:hypothetical protein